MRAYCKAGHCGVCLTRITHQAQRKGSLQRYNQSEWFVSCVATHRYLRAGPSPITPHWRESSLCGWPDGGCSHHIMDCHGSRTGIRPDESVRMSVVTQASGWGLLWKYSYIEIGRDKLSSAHTPVCLHITADVCPDWQLESAPVSGGVTRTHGRSDPLKGPHGE